MGTVLGANVCLHAKFTSVAENATKEPGLWDYEILKRRILEQQAIINNI